MAKTPDGEWVKVGTQPLVTFNSSEWDTVGLSWYPGAIEPSLVSFDEGGKVYLFYEESEVFKSNYAWELDLSDLNNIVKGGRKVIERTGVSDLGTSNPLLYGGDFVYDPDSDYLFAARESRTTATANPIVADEVQVLRSSMDILDEIVQGPTQEEPRVWWEEIGDSIDARRHRAPHGRHPHFRVYPYLLSLHRQRPLRAAARIRQPRTALYHAGERRGRAAARRSGGRLRVFADDPFHGHHLLTGGRA